MLFNTINNVSSVKLSLLSRNARNGENCEFEITRGAPYEVEITTPNVPLDGANIQIGRQKWLLGEGRS